VDTFVPDWQALLFFVTAIVCSVFVLALLLKGSNSGAQGLLIFAALAAFMAGFSMPVWSVGFIVCIGFGLLLLLLLVRIFWSEQLKSFNA
jgi:hypothetical protein